MPTVTESSPQPAALRVVVMDDYQQVIGGYADWRSLGPDTEVSFLQDHLGGEELIKELAGAEVVVAVRERTPLPAAVLDQLPDLKLIVTTGMANASIDLDAAGSRGIVVCGTGGVPHSAAN